MSGARQANRRASAAPRLGSQSWGLGSGNSDVGGLLTRERSASLVPEGLSPFHARAAEEGAVPQLGLAGLPKLDLQGISAASYSSSRMSSALASIKSTDDGPSAMIQVVPDPDAVPDPEDNERQGEEGDEASAPAEAPAPAPAEAVPASDGSRANSDAGQEAENADSKPTRLRPGVKSPASPNSELLKGQTAKNISQINKYYANKDLMSPRKAAKLMASKAAMKGDLQARKAAQEANKADKVSVLEQKKEEERKRRAVARIQARERGRQALRYVKVLRLQAWALEVVQRGLVRWVQISRRKAAEEAARKEAERLRQEKLAQERAEREAAKRAAREEAERERLEREAEEAQAPGAARRRAKAKGEVDVKEEQMKKKKIKDKAAHAAANAVKEAQIEATRERDRAEMKRQKQVEQAEAERHRMEEEKAEEARALQRQQQAAKEEAFQVVRNFAEGLQDLAAAGEEQSEEIRTAGGIPPLVAMLGGGVMPVVESASATALTHISQASEANRIAIRKAGGFPPLIALAAQSYKNGTMKYVGAMTALGTGTNPQNQDAIREAGGMPLLVGLLPGGPDSKVTCEAMIALRYLTFENPTNSNALREAGGITWMVALLQAGPEHPVVTDAVITLTQIVDGNPANHDAIREAGGIRPLIALLAGDVASEPLIWAARCLSHLTRDNTANRNVVCEQQGTIARLVMLLGSGAEVEGAVMCADVLRCLMLGNDDRIAVSVLAAMRRQGVGLGQNATFSLSDTFPTLLEGLTSVVGARLSAAVKNAKDRGQIQMALNDAIALELPEDQLEAARARLDAIAAARAEAIAARKARGDRKKAGLDKDKSNNQNRDTSPDKAGATTKENDKSDKDAQASSQASGAMLVLMEAQQKLRDLEAAAAAARRDRRDASLKRQESGLRLNPKMRREFSSKILGAAARVELMQAEMARSHEEHELEEMRQEAAAFDTRAGAGGLDGDPNTPG
jgi:hypothetical protein